MLKHEPRILVILAWFGKWPGWIRPFLESCRWNPSVDWLIATDCGAPEDLPGNVRLHHTTFEAYRAFIGEKLAIAPAWRDAYKLCDLKPALGFVHRDVAKDYDYWAFGDLDVIYGDIRAVLTPDVLRHDLVSCHDHIVAGHLSLLRTTPRMLEAFTRVRGWRDMLAEDRHRSFDEQIFSRMFMQLPLRSAWRRMQTPWLGGALFREQFSTDIDPLPFVDGTRRWPTEWVWREGKLTNDRAHGREFLYLHFSHWQSSRWTRDAQAPWRGLAKIDNLPPGRPNAFRISREGFTPLERPSTPRPLPAAAA
jgi:hypothetical protein